ncbi:MAG: hypothetical protein COX30_04570 [Candidatus Moranbacteria bacterium CG23_combo_of_CG06-09_8_20_14_all_39_10]|nr:MAG: hypothetical protein COX30_04570 [Candidatus Moranbacteria bacterium CG23_combo_of_CG06-09_8_20_14_all_39_10]
MKIKTIQLPFLVLSFLVIASFSFYVTAQENATTTNNIFLDSDQDGLSDEEEKLYGTDLRNSDTDGDSYSDGAEIKSGYDPLKPSPGDKIIPEPITAPQTISVSDRNLTQEAAAKMTMLLQDASADDTGVTVDQLSSIADETIAIEAANSAELPQISADKIKIKKQNYNKLSSEKADIKRKEDLTTYITGLAYIFSSNSPKPITSTSDISSSLMSSFTQEITKAFESGNPNSLSGFEASAQKILEQMKDLEVPEEMALTHIKGLQLVTYALQLKSAVAPDINDPLRTVVNYSKVVSLIEVAMEFSNETEILLEKYNLNYDTDIQPKLADYGIDIPTD